MDKPIERKMNEQKQKIPSPLDGKGIIHRYNTHENF